EYLLEFFRSDLGLEAMRTASPGTQVRNKTLSPKSLAETRVPVPQLDVQGRIVEHLGGLAVESLHHTRLARLGQVAMPGNQVKIRELVSEVSRVVPVAAGEEYPMQG